MKRFVETVFAIKVNACLCFTGIMIVSVLVELLWGITLVAPWRVTQMLVLSLICGALQYVFYSGRVVKRMGSFGRVTCFMLLLFMAVAAFAVAFGWFPLEHLSAWGVFFGIFIVAFLAIGTGFEIMFRITGRRYTNLLDQAQNQK